MRPFKIFLFLIIILSWLVSSAFQPFPQSASILQSSSSFSVVQVNLTAPVDFGKVSPTLGQTGLPTTGLELKWDASVTAGVTYQYCLRNNNRNCPKKQWVSVGTNTQTTMAILNANTTYYWQVRAVDAAGNMTYANGGTWWSFKTTFGAPTPFAKLSPANPSYSQPVNGLVLSWNPSTGVNVNYEYCYRSAAQSPPCSTWFQTGTATSAVLNDLTYNTLYFWQVRAFNTSGKTDADSGAEWQFTTQVALPQSFSKELPAIGATGIPLVVNLTWSPSEGASRYFYCIKTSPGTTCDTGQILVGSATQANTATLLYGATYYWQVYAENSIGQQIEAIDGWRSFTTIPEPLAAFNKTGPANGAIDQSLTPALNWGSPNDPATTYAYCISATEACTSGTWVPIPVNTVIQVPGGLLANDTTYYWQVRAGGTVDANGGVWWHFQDDESTTHQ